MRTLKTKTQGEVRSDSPFGAELRLARKCKRAKMKREEYLTSRRETIMDVAKKHKWDRSSTAMMLADVTLAADDTWPVK